MAAILQRSQKLDFASRANRPKYSETERNAGRIEALSAVVRDLIYEVRGNKSDEAHEREKMALRLETGMLRFERRLPPPIQN